MKRFICFGLAAGLAFLFAAVVGCGSLRTAPNQLVVEKRWVRNTLATPYLGGRRIHRFAPILTEKMVIVGNSIDGVSAYDRNSARLVWRLRLDDGSEGGGFVADDILYFGSGDGQLYAAQVDDGKVLWTYPLKAEGIARPVVHGGTLYVLGGNNVVHALNAKTGKLSWIYNRREASNISIRGGSQPLVAGDSVLVGLSDGALVALNRSSGAVNWETNLNRNKRFRDVDATPVLDGQTVYISSYDGSLNALSLTDGKILWTVENGGYDEVAVAGSQLFFSSTDGKVMALDKSTGKVIWSKDTQKGISTGPSLIKGTVVAGEMSGALRFYDLRSGETLGSFEPGRGVTSRATVDSKKGEVYFVSHDANLFALRVNWKRYAREWPWD